MKKSKRHILKSLYGQSNIKPKMGTKYLQQRYWMTGADQIPLRRRIVYDGIYTELGDLTRSQFLALDFFDHITHLTERKYEHIREAWEVRAEQHCLRVLQGGQEAWEMEYEACRVDKVWMYAHWWKIVDYEASTMRLFLNPIQRDYWRNRGSVEDLIDVILKARKQGLSTAIIADFGHDVMFKPHTQAISFSYKREAAAEFRKRFSFSLRNLPPFLRPVSVKNNVSEISFLKTAYGDPLESSFVIDGARSFAAGRGLDIDRLHLSEYAHYNDAAEMFTALVDAMRSGGRLAIESTPMGDNDFAIKFREGDKHYKEKGQAVQVYRSHFYTWFNDPRYQLRVPSNVTMEYTDEEKKLVAAHGLQKEQIRWRRNRSARYTGDGGRYKFLREYPEDKRTCFLISASGHVFDLERLNDLRLILQTMEAPPTRKTKGGTIEIYREPEEGHRYVIGSDSSEGESGSHPAGAGVLDIDTGEQVASVHGLITPINLAKIISELGYEYNTALLAVERNNPGVAVLQELLHHISYPNVYWDTPFSSGRKTYSQSKSGWSTNGTTKPLIIEAMREALDETNEIIVNDYGFVDECMTFIRKPDSQGRPTKASAQEGCDDDRVMYWAIAWYVRKMILAGTVSADMGLKVVSLNEKKAEAA